MEYLRIIILQDFPPFFYQTRTFSLVIESQPYRGLGALPANLVPNPLWYERQIAVRKLGHMRDLDALQVCKLPCRPILSGWFVVPSFRRWR